MSTGTKQSSYALLGVPRTASAADIKSAYRRLARACHPDTHPDDPTAGERFTDITAAYETLMDPRRRAVYDRGFLPIRSLDDLYRRDPSGQRFLAMVLPTGTRAPVFGSNLALVVPVPAALLAHGGPVRVTVPKHRHRDAMTITVDIPNNTTTRAWCRVAGLGSPGRHGGDPGDLYLAIVPQEDGEQEQS